MAARRVDLLFLGLLLACSGGARQSSETAAQASDCDKCEPETCAEPDGCLAGVVLDECRCCYVCARREGEKCGNFALSYKHKYGICGENMVCQLRSDLKKWEGPEALCVCKDQQMVCGSDGKTYSSICRLREEAASQSGLAGRDDLLHYWGPCRTAPWIVSPPNDTAGILHGNLALDCETRGFPIPAVHWQFQDKAGQTIVLPSDDQFVAVQVRGGPETLMITGWVQIMDLKPTDAGTYTCVASNTEGQAQASASVIVLEN